MTTFYYTLLVFFLWLTHGTPSLVLGSFNPWSMAFIIAIIVDILFQKPWTWNKPTA